MDATRDPHAVLGVPPGADPATVKRAFRARAREHHPDRSDDPAAEARFRELVDAYERLGGTRPRARESRADLSAVVSFYAWLAGRAAQTTGPDAEPEPERAPDPAPPRRSGERSARVAAAVGLLYALALLVFVLTR